MTRTLITYLVAVLVTIALVAIVGTDAALVLAAVLIGVHDVHEAARG